MGAVMIKVLVWCGNGSGLASQGHAALAVTKAHAANVSQFDTYISWFPDETSTRDYRGFDKGKNEGDFFNDECGKLSFATQLGLNNNTITPRPNQTKSASLDFDGTQIENPTNRWVNMPNFIVDIPCLDDNGRNGSTESLGLCQANLKSWWSLRTDAVNHQTLAYKRFKLISKKFNCASVVMGALMAAGSKLFCNPPSAVFAVSPKDIRDYALKLQKKINQLNQRMLTVNNQDLANFRKYQQQPGTAFRPDTGDIWTFEEWRQASAVSGIARRKEQVARIDQLIQEYWATGNWTRSNSYAKENLLEAMLVQIQDHLLQKPQSDRRHALVKLGIQIRDKMETELRRQNNFTSIYSGGDDDDY